MIRFTLLIVAFLKVGCDGLLGSEVQFDRCGVCGGDNTTCHIISGIFTQAQLPHGYNRITTIPAGACNINITEMLPSQNYLALRYRHGKYLINGNWAIGISGDYSGAGTVFHYSRPNDPTGHEHILSKGPINTTIDIMVIKQELNKGIAYYYTLPLSAGEKGSHNRRHHNSQATDAGSTLNAKNNNKQETDDSEKVTGEAQQDKASDERYLEYVHRLQREQNDAAAVQSSPGNSLQQFEQAFVGNYQQRTPEDETSQQRKRKPLPRSGESSHISNVESSRYVSSQQSARVPSSAYQGVVNPGRHRPLADSQEPDVQPLVRSPSTYGGRQGAADGYRPASSQPQSARYPSVVSAYRQPQYDEPAQPSSYNSYAGYGQPASGRNPYGYPAAYPTQRSSPYGQYPNQQAYPGQQLSPPYQSQNPPQAYPQPAYVPPSPSRYDPYRGNYYGQGQQAAFGDASGGYRNNGLLNDQIPLALPHSARSPDDSGVRRDIDYVWKVSGFSQCSQSCGGGTQVTQIVCVETSAQAIVTEENCDATLKPQEQTVSCNSKACPPGWSISEWSDCSTSCDRGQQTRSVECKQRISPELEVRVPIAECVEQKPHEFQSCNEERPCVRWKIGDWSECSAECGRGQRTREVACLSADDRVIPENKCEGSRPKSMEICDMGSCAKTWFFTKWSDTCSTECGDGIHVRKLFCSADKTRCNELHKPKAEKACKNEIPCGGKWFTGPWSKCSLTCGTGIISRDVVCMKKLGHALALVGDENCVAQDRPISEEPCENAPCGPEWYTTDWSECSKSCDTGSRTREARCLSESQETSFECKENDKPQLKETCNPNPCPSPKAPQAGEAPSQTPQCQDKFKNCKVVVQARLCRYSYYKDICCYTCTLHDYYHPHDS